MIFQFGHSREDYRNPDVGQWLVERDLNHGTFADNEHSPHKMHRAYVLRDCISEWLDKRNVKFKLYRGPAKGQTQYGYFIEIDDEEDAVEFKLRWL